jgi:hypothetical protein
MFWLPNIYIKYYNNNNLNIMRGTISVLNDLMSSYSYEM